MNQALNKFFLKLDEKYARGVSYVLQHRKKFIAVLVGLLFLSFVGVKFVGFIFMPESSSDTVGIEVELPNGTTLNVTEDTLRMLEEIGKNELKGVKFTAIKVGGTSVISSTYAPCNVNPRIFASACASFAPSN